MLKFDVGDVVKFECEQRFFYGTVRKITLSESEPVYYICYSPDENWMQYSGDQLEPVNVR